MAHLRDRFVVSLPSPADRRREKWLRYAPFAEHLHLVIPEIGDDLDEQDERWVRLEAKVGKLTGIALGLLISTTTGVVLLALNLIAGRS